VVLSKAHAAEVIYAVLPEIGYVPKRHLINTTASARSFRATPTGGVPPGLIIPAVRSGRGLSFAAGMAMAEKIKTAMNPPDLHVSAGNMLALHHEFQPSLSYLLYCW